MRPEGPAALSFSAAARSAAISAPVTGSSSAGSEGGSRRPLASYMAREEPPAPGSYSRLTSSGSASRSASALSGSQAGGW